MSTLISILMILFLILYLSEKYKNRKSSLNINKIENKYADELKNNMELSKEIDKLKSRYEKENTLSEYIKELHSKTRQLKHDMKNHIMVITSYLNDEDYDKAKDYMSEILGRLNRMYTYIETGNSLLNYIVNQKLEKAKENGIDIKAEIDNISFSKIGSVDFSDLLNNLLDNAIEASVKEKDKQIELNILKKKGFNTILIKNKISKSILNKNPDLISTKKIKEEHGFGIKKIKSVVEKYDGMLDIYEKDNYFCVYVVYPS